MNQPIVIVQTNLGYWRLLMDGFSEFSYTKKIAELPSDNVNEAKEIVLAHNSAFLKEKSRPIMY